LEREELLKPYDMILFMDGIRYEIDRIYLSNLYFIKKVISNENIHTLEEFINAYYNIPFEGSSDSGLVFSDNGVLLKFDNQTYATAGSYELKTVEEKKILLLHPTDTNLYPKNWCFLVDFDHVEEGECHFKGESESIQLYNSDSYQQIEKYLQEYFTDVYIEIES
jgi:hypothetical protein